jgi:hypothetical protein
MFNQVAIFKRCCTVVQLIKSYPKYFWDSKEKEWSISTENVENFKDKIKSMGEFQIVEDLILEILEIVPVLLDNSLLDNETNDNII